MTNMEVILFFFFNPLLLLAFKPLIAFVRVGKKLGGGRQKNIIIIK